MSGQPNTSAELAVSSGPPLSLEVMEKLALNADLSGLTPVQKIEYYGYRCRKLGLDPGAKPFEILTLNGKQVLYATKACTEQLTALHKLSVQVVERLHEGDLYIVRARCSSPDGRFSDNDGVVPTAGLRGDALANSYMKATTKACRRSVLAHMGLGMLDETEVETIPGARRAPAPMPEIKTAAPVPSQSWPAPSPAANREPGDDDDGPDSSDEARTTLAQVYAERIISAHSMDELATIAASAQKDLTRKERDELLPIFTNAQRVLKGMRDLGMPSTAKPAPAPAEPVKFGMNEAPWTLKDGVPYCKKHLHYPMRTKTGNSKGTDWTRYYCTAKDPAGKNGYCVSSGFDNEIFGESQIAGGGRHE